MCSDECIAQERGHILFVPEGAEAWTFESKKGAKCARRCWGVDLREQKGGKMRSKVPGLMCALFVGRI